MPGTAFCVAVGRRKTRARYRLRDPEAVRGLLAWLGAVLGRPEKPHAVRYARRER